MTPEESLQLISDTIVKSRRDFERNSGSPMILWGIVVLVVSLAVWTAVKLTENQLWNFLWFAIPLIGWPAMRFCIKDARNKKAKNFINETIGQIWIGYGIFATATAVVLAFINPIYLGTIHIAMLGLGAYITGRILKNNYITVGSLITGIGGAVALALADNCDYTLVLSAASVISLILPGIMINSKADKN